MANMGYCRFENTYRDLQDYYTAMADNNKLSETEEKYKVKLLKLCKDIIGDFGDEEEEEESEESA